MNEQAEWGEQSECQESILKIRNARGPGPGPSKQHSGHPSYIESGNKQYTSFHAVWGPRGFAVSHTPDLASEPLGSWPASPHTSTDWLACWSGALSGCPKWERSMRTFFSFCTAGGHSCSFLWPGFLLKGLGNNGGKKQESTENHLRFQIYNKEAKVTINNLRARRLGNSGWVKAAGRTYSQHPRRRASKIRRNSKAGAKTVPATNLLLLLQVTPSRRFSGISCMYQKQNQKSWRQKEGLLVCASAIWSRPNPHPKTQESQRTRWGARTMITRKIQDGHGPWAAGWHTLVQAGPGWN